MVTLSISVAINIRNAANRWRFEIYPYGMCIWTPLLFIMLIYGASGVNDD